MPSPQNGAAAPFRTSRAEAENDHFPLDHVAWAWAWDETHNFQDLNQRLDPSTPVGYWITSANAISQDGVIAANALRWNQSEGLWKRRGVLLIPPQPVPTIGPGAILLVR